jgi:hypothetical protein
VYERDFLTWFAPAAEQARMVAAHGFAPIGEGFIKERQRELEAERHRQDEWLRQRTSEILPVVQVPSAQQLSLFGATAADLPTLETHAPWQTLTDSVARLAAFHGDASQPARLRSEADGVLRIYRQRIADLEARLTLRAPEVMLLGVLMIVPGFVA